LPRHPAILLLVAPLLAQPAVPATPSAAYLAYLAATRDAKVLADLLPHLSKAYRAMLQSRAKEDHPVWVGRLKEGADLKDVKIESETVSGRSCVLRATATSAGGNRLRAKIVLVKEGSAWLLSESFWAT